MKEREEVRIDSRVSERNLDHFTGHFWDFAQICHFSPRLSSLGESSRPAFRSQAKNFYQS